MFFLVGDLKGSLTPETKQNGLLVHLKKAGKKILIIFLLFAINWVILSVRWILKMLIMIMLK